MNSLLEKKLNFNKNIKINFDGDNLTSDAGLLLYKEFDAKIGFSNAIKRYFNPNDNAKFRTHSNEDILIQKIYQHIARYHTDDSSDELKNEPVFKTILDKEVLPSQPTISRFNNRLDVDSIKDFELINEKLMDIIYTIERPKHILIDLDSTNCATYGNQYGSNYNSHYSSNGFHPLVAFDGLILE
ncbi:MAG: transposase [Sarcina sp.]